MKKMNLHVPALLASVALIVPHDPGKPGWKMNAEGTAIEMKDGNPIWVDSNGAESTMGGDTISRLNAEARSHRERAEAAETKLKPFEGIDPAAAKKALETVGKLDAKQLIDAGEVDKVKQQIEGQYTEKLSATEKLAADRLAQLNARTLESTFATSKFVQDKLALPVDIAQTYFAKHISFDDNGQMIIKDASGNQIRSKAKIGEVAGFDEALELLIQDNPNRDAILKGGNHQGSGNNGGGGSGKPGMKTYRRSEFDKLAIDNPAAANAAAKEIAAGTAQVLD